MSAMEQPVSQTKSENNQKGKSQAQATKPRVLEGIKILDFSIGASGPFCTRLLADWGAQVLKIESLNGDLARGWDSVVHGMSSAYIWLNRNKESMTVNLKTKEGIEIIHKLVKDVDVVLENFSPGVVKKLKIDYESLRKINPSMIYCHISGYGQDGPFRDQKAFDLLMQGETGLILMNGSPDAPAKLPLSVCDTTAGTYASLGIAMALYNREKKAPKEGHELEVTMFDSILSLLGYFPHFFWHRGEMPLRVGMKHHLLTPYGPYLAKDKKYISIACLSQEHWKKFCNQVINRPDLPERPEFKDNETRLSNRLELESIIGKELLKRERDDWLKEITSAGIPCGCVNDLSEVLSHPQLVHRGLVRIADTAHGKTKVIDNPIRFSGMDSRVENISELGEHTEKVLLNLGYTEKKINELRLKSVI